ncbi:MAG: glycosyltransferase family 4 protein [Proteobacteria bacterium]|nr:glycosyltransferase family 4 protein [Pseudomonadota bacterium]
MATRSKILYLSHKPECGGAEKSLLDLLAGLDRARFEPYLVTSRHGELADAATKQQVPVYTIPMDFNGKFNKLNGLLRASRHLARLLCKHRFELIHANTLHAGYTAVLSRTGLPLIWHLRDLEYPFIGRKTAAFADLLIANSGATANMFPKHWKDKGRVKVIYNGIDPIFFKMIKPSGFLHRALGIKQGLPLVGLVGRLSPWKGQEDLIQAAPLVKEKAHFLIIGGQPFIGNKNDLGFPEKLAKMTNALNISDRVHFLGHRQDVNRVMAELTLLVHPSKKPEPFGRDIAEAFALGLPVIGSAEGGVLEIIDDGKNGLLFPPGSPHALAKAIDQLLGAPETARSMGRKGRQKALECFTADQHARQIEQAYVQTLQMAGTGGKTK